LLLYLAVERGRPIRRATLQDLVFPDQTEKNAAHSLRELVYQLRRSGAAFIADGNGIAIGRDQAWLDFEGLDATGRLADAQVAQLEGGFLPGYAPEYSESLSEWLAGARARTTFALTRALVVAARQSRSVGDWVRAERAARACLAFDPVNEEATLVLAEALAIGGAKAQAIQLLDAFISEVSESSRSLSLPASVLRRRIGEHTASYSSSPSRSQFVGRDAEMQILTDCLKSARAHRGNAAVVIGDAGLGKTRLAQAFVELAELEGVRTVSVTAQPHDVHRPFGVFADLLPSLMALPGALGASPDSLRRLEWLTAHRAEGVDTFAESVEASESMLHALTHAIIDLIDAISTECTLLLFVEDLHSRDEASRRILGYLLSAHKRRRLLVLTTSRLLSVVHSFPAEAVTPIALGALEDAAMVRLIEAHCETAGCIVDEAMSEWLRTACAGNPLFLESLLGHFADTGQRFGFPPTLSGLLKGRISGLSERALVVLQMCALLGRRATPELIEEATELPRYELTRGIHELEAARLVRTTDRLVQPWHALVGDTARELTSPTELQMLHRHVAMTLEKHIDEDRSATIVWECAEHWLASGGAERALKAVHRCARHAVDIGRPDAAAGLLSRALALSATASERSAIARQLVVAADACANNELVFEAVAALRSERQPVQHDDIEFAEFRARTREYRLARQGEQPLLNCVRDRDATPDHRVAAAVQLLKYADTNLDRELAATAVGALPEDVVARANRVARLEYLTIRSASVGEIAMSAEYARELVAAAQSEPSIRRVPLTINAAIAMGHSGNVEEALALAEGAWNEAMELTAVSFSLKICTFVAETHIELGHRDVGLQWLAKCDQLIEEYPTLARDFTVAALHLGIAMVDEDAGKARSIFDSLDRSGAFEGGNLRIRWRRVAAVRIRQLEGSHRITDDDLAALMTGARDGAILGGICDLEAGTAALALLGSGKREEARDWLSRYLNEHRRSRGSLSAGLSIAMERAAAGARLLRKRTDKRRARHAADLLSGSGECPRVVSKQ
jgi:DNA-binding SARP family transcriptional activator